MTKRYGSERIKKGLTHFMLGKGVSAITGLGASLLVIRVLSIESFAAYSVLVALVDVIETVSGLGFGHALVRYVPELYSKHFQKSLGRFVFGSLALRTGFLMLMTLVVYAFSAQLAPLVGLSDALVGFKVFLLVVVLRSTAHLSSLILESTLHQGAAQFGFSLSAMTRLIGMCVLLYRHQSALVDVIWVEVIADGLSLLVMLFSISRVVSLKNKDQQNPEDDGFWFRKHSKQVINFALSGYATHLAISAYGGSTNRLIGGSLLTVGAMATFGFAQSLYEYVRRYMPAQLLIGLIRPIVVSRYCEKRDFSAPASLCANILQINILLIAGGIALLVVGGGDVLALISGGKYSVDAVPVLIMLFVVLILDTQRQLLEVLAVTIERYDHLILSYILLSVSVVIAVFLVPTLGAVAFPVANALALLVTNMWIQHKLSKDTKFRIRHDWVAIFKVIVVCEMALLVGDGTKYLGLPWYYALLLSTIIYSTLAFLLCGNMVRNFIKDLTGRSKAPAAI
ncbi:MAG: oligosaccharide flippase family protein [Methyloglobulus sp.]|nr:oligosaccharide flippase family protein [Methyloglobulus sp.]